MCIYAALDCTAAATRSVIIKTLTTAEKTDRPRRGAPLVAPRSAPARRFVDAPPPPPPPQRAQRTGDRHEFKTALMAPENRDEEDCQASAPSSLVEERDSVQRARMASL